MMLAILFSTMDALKNGLQPYSGVISIVFNENRITSVIAAPRAVRARLHSAIIDIVHIQQRALLKVISYWLVGIDLVIELSWVERFGTECLATFVVIRPSLVVALAV